MDQHSKALRGLDRDQMMDQQSEAYLEILDNLVDGEWMTVLLEDERIRMITLVRDYDKETK